MPVEATQPSERPDEALNAVEPLRELSVAELLTDLNAFLTSNIKKYEEINGTSLSDNEQMCSYGQAKGLEQVQLYIKRYEIVEPIHSTQVLRELSNMMGLDNNEDGTIDMGLEEE